MGMDAPPGHGRQQPLSRTGLGAALRELGIGAGDVLLVHASLSSLGHVIGGAVAVVQAMLDVLGPTGTLVVPAFTAGNSDPSRWARTRKSAVPAAWWPDIREHLPAFEPAISPSENVGAVAEAVRTWPGAVRSGHPQTSFTALGPDAARLMSDHPVDCHLGPGSPLGRLAELADPPARVLLLGVPFAVCTAFHLAEYRQPDPPQRDYECVIHQDGRRAWYRYRDVLLDDSDFQQIGDALESAPSPAALVRRGAVGAATARLVPLFGCVRFATEWMAVHRVPGHGRV